MANVVFSGELLQLAGEAQYQTSACDYRSLVKELLLKYQAIDESVLTNMAIVIDGVIIPDPYLDKIPSGAEVHFIHFIAAG